MPLNGFHKESENMETSLPIILYVYSQHSTYTVKWPKNDSWYQVPVDGRGHLMTKMNIIFFMGNEFSNSFSYNNFFEDSIILGANNEKNFFFGSGRGIDISIFYVKTIDNTTETSDGFAKLLSTVKTIDNLKL